VLVAVLFVAWSPGALVAAAGGLGVGRAPALGVGGRGWRAFAGGSVVRRVGGGVVA